MLKHWTSLVAVLVTVATVVTAEGVTVNVVGATNSVDGMGMYTYEVGRTTSSADEVGCNVLHLFKTQGWVTLSNTTGDTSFFRMTSVDSIGFNRCHKDCIPQNDQSIDGVRRRLVTMSEKLPVGMNVHGLAKLHCETEYKFRKNLVTVAHLKHRYRNPGQDRRPWVYHTNESVVRSFGVFCGIFSVITSVLWCLLRKMRPPLNAMIHFFYVGVLFWCGMTDSDRARGTMVRVCTDPGDVREINGRTGRIQCVRDDGYIVQIQVGLDYIYVQLWDDEVETCFETHTGVYDQLLQEGIPLAIALVLFPEMSFTCKSLLVLVLEVWGIFRVEVRIFMLARTLEFLLVLTRVMKAMGTMSKNTFFRLTFVVTHLLGSYVVATEDSVSVGTTPLQDVCPGLHQTTDINVLGASFVFVGLCCVLLGCVQMRTRSKNRLHVAILLHDISYTT